MITRRWVALMIGLATAGVVVWWPGALRTPDGTVKWHGHLARDHGPRQGQDGPATNLILGRVVDGSQPVAGARVRFKGSPEFALTDDDGRFELAADSPHGATLTAAKEGYLIAGVAATDETLTGPIELRLTALPVGDDHAYRWIDPAPDGKSGGACGNCHQAIYDEWKTSGHARSATNRHFLNLLDGSDWRGEAGHGWGMAQEYPEGIAVCWSCHAPTFEPNVVTSGRAILALNHGQDARATSHGQDARATRPIEGVDAAGVHCDFCHKIRAANVERVGLTHGRFAYELLRPAEGQLFFGPLDDVDRGEDAWSPLQRDSRFCAACHEGTLFGVDVYTTYSEWLESPAGRAGRQCQDCHMRPSGLTNIAPGSGGIERDPQTLAGHAFLPAGREAMLRRALAVSCSAERAGGDVAATVRLRTRDIGHRLPTGFIDRQLLLIVEPSDAQGRSCKTIGGPRLPAAAGDGLSGEPGRLFAKLLTDAEGNSPAPFWRAGATVLDDRLPPDEPVETAFVFSGETARVRVRVVYRRFWRAVGDSKAWPDTDVVVYDRSFAVTRPQRGLIR